VLGWFQRAWHHEDPEALVDAEIGGGSYGFDSIFEAIEEHRLPCPQTLVELHDLLDEHLWVESDDVIRLDERGLRVRTNDDEVDLAYYFLEDEAIAAYPDRLAYLVNDTWPLPSGAAAPGTTFTPDVPVRFVGPPGPAPDSVYAVRMAGSTPTTTARTWTRRKRPFFLASTCPDLPTTYAVSPIPCPGNASTPTCSAPLSDPATAASPPPCTATSASSRTTCRTWEKTGPHPARD